MNFPLSLRRTIGLGLLAATIVLAAGVMMRREADTAESNGQAGALPSEPMPTPEVTVLRPLTPNEALAVNQETKRSSEPMEAAPSFVLPVEGLTAVTRRSAIDCMTAAIYYEAASEVPRGQRAVAQVVLNRMRHPAFPKSICGVVYQGSERRTGCQFSFTCDGSLMRKPSRAGWDRARLVAQAALDGAVEPSVGMATHYHTVWVVPYWASSLAKIETVGAHIFYRWKGGWGRRRSFTGRYDGESGVTPDLVSEVTGLSAPEDAQVSALPAALRQPLLVADETGTLTLDAPATPLEGPPPPPLLADETAGALRLDEGRPKGD